MDGSQGAEITQRPEIICPVATVWLDLAVFSQSSINIGIFAEYLAIFEFEPSDNAVEMTKFPNSSRTGNVQF